MTRGGPGKNTGERGHRGTSGSLGALLEKFWAAVPALLELALVREVILLNPIKRPSRSSRSTAPNPRRWPRARRWSRRRHWTGPASRRRRFTVWRKWEFRGRSEL